MKLRLTLSARFLCSAIIILCGSALVSLGQTTPAPPQPAQSQVMTTTTPAADALSTPKIPNEELDALVAPIALYSDSLLAQTLAASTYPLEVIQLQQWMNNNKNLKGKELADAVAKLPYDPSVQSMAGVPDALQRMAGNISWTTDLGNAFLAQQQDVMDAVQRMRAKAQGNGALKTSQQQVVETKTVEGGKQVIVVEQPSTDVVYVPSYDPAVVYGPAPYAYPYYPYAYSGYYAGMGLAFGTGIVLGAAWGNNWGNCNWGGGDININNNNNFNRNNFNQNNINRNNVNRGQGGKNNWQHNPQHRGSAPYGDRGTANRYGGNARQRQGGASNRPGQAGGGIANRPGGGAGIANRPGGGAGANRPGGGTGANRPGGGANRPGGGGAGSRPSGGRASTMPANRGSAGGGAGRVGNHSVSSRPSYSSHGGGFGGGGSGSYSRASSSRGGHSMGGGGYSRGGGGGFHGGGGGGHRGGGGRGGGGRRR